MSETSNAPNTDVVLDPMDSLSFQLQQSTSPQAVLTIRNASENKYIAFKVKTTRPLRYLVRPNQGMLGPNESSCIMVILQQKDCDELIRLDPFERQLTNDKFLVQSIYVSDEFYTSAKLKKNSKEMSEDLIQLWSQTAKKDMLNKKLRCRFTTGSSTITEEDEADSSDAASSPTKIKYNDTMSTQQGQKELSSSQQGMKSIRSSDSPPKKITTSKELSSALLEETNTSKSKLPPETVAEVAALRKKYDELVAFTVQLTAQRDALVSDLDKARAMLQKNTRSPAGVENNDNLRQRKVGHIKTGATTTPNDQNRGLQKRRGEVKDPPTFGLFHLLVCALIFFLIGRYN